MPERFYATTPIYYVNDVPHIGHAYTTVATDALVRWHRLLGHDARMLTGVDEHGQKVAQAAAERQMTPQQHADDINPRWHELLDLLAIANDDFIRTTEQRHTTAVQAFMQRLYDKGDLYTDTYSGPYCVRCEAYYTPEELVGDELCPIHQRPVEHYEQTNWFFRLSDYADDLLALYDGGFVEPEVRRNEVRAFVQSGLNDISATRSAFDWGVPVPWEPGSVFYVWFDALLNYLTALGDGDLRDRYWPADVHVIGKDILRFHAVYWPAMLIAAGVEVPRQVFAHGFLLVGGEKMGKSNATGIDPHDLVRDFGRDCYRYYFLREISFGQDGTFSWESMAQRYRTDLANDLGNLVNRVLNMITRYRDGVVPAPAAGDGDAEHALAVDLDAAVTGMHAFSDLAFKRALDALWIGVGAVNRYVETRQPWSLARSGDDELLDTTLYRCADALRRIAVLASPVLVDSAAALWGLLGQAGDVWDARLPDDGRAGRLEPGSHVATGAVLFPRLDEPA